MASMEKTRAFLEGPHFAVMATINRDGSPQLTVMWYALHPTEDVVMSEASSAKDGAFALAPGYKPKA